TASSSAFSAVDFPAPDMPVTITMRRSLAASSWVPACAFATPPARGTARSMVSAGMRRLPQGPASGGLAHGEPHLGGARGRKRIEGEKRHTHPEEITAAAVRQPFDQGRCDQLDRQAHARFGDRGNRQNTEATHFDAAGDGV